MLYQRRIFDFVRGFNPALSPVADYEIYLRIARDFPVCSHNEVIVEYRQHRSNMSRDVLAMEHAAIAVHDAQWDFVKANSRYREAYDAGACFWRKDYPFQQIVSRIREIVREQLPPDAAIAVATAGKTELLRLDGRRTWHFPQADKDSKGELFAHAAEGSVTTQPWIESGMTYEFSLYGGPEFSKLLAKLLVKGIADPRPLANVKSPPQQSAREDGVLLTAIPNPVHAGDEPGVTDITWSTGDGSEGQVYISSTGVYPGHDPVNSDEAWVSLESTRKKGAEYLIMPAQSFWWLDDYQEFRKRVEARYPVVARDDDTCIIFDLREQSQ